MFPFEHIEKKKRGGPEASEEGLLSELKKGRCFQMGCEEKPCVELGKSYYSCLVHFVAEADATMKMGEGAVEVIDQKALMTQTPQCNELWKEAIAEVVLEMFSLQKEEEEVMRKDPLSILGMNNPKHKSSLAKMHGSAVAESVTAGRLGGEKKSSTMTPMKRKASAAVTDAYARIAQRRDDGALGAIEANAKTMHEETAEEKQLKLREEEMNAAGVACNACGSRWTETRTLGLLDNSRTETWGFKDAPSTFSVACNKCKHVATFTE
jgi:DNA-directed RNA polymerase subunit M/transcription elongation factor TFIIS